MSVQLLDKTRKINKLLHNNNSHKVVFNDICKVLSEILLSNILVISKKGKVLGVSIWPGVDEIEELIDDKVGGYVDKMLNERLLSVLSTKENVNLATLGFAEIIRAVFQWDKLGPLTNGSNLLRNFPTFNSVLYPFIVAGICIGLIVLLINSTYGRAFKAIRDDEIAAEAMGINLAHHKQLAFVISSFFAGVSGGLLAMYQTTIQASMFKSAMTYEILLIVVIGGIGSITGSCIGSFLFIACSEWWLRFLDNSNLYIGDFHLTFMRPGFRKVVFSIIIMAIVLFYRKGIMGDREFSIEAVQKFFRKRFKKKQTVEGGSSHE